MEAGNKVTITVETTVHVPIEKVWEYWTEPQHITKWCNASDDWHSPNAENDLRVGGRFLTRMEAKDGSSGFDFNISGQKSPSSKSKRFRWEMNACTSFYFLGERLFQSVVS